MASKGGLLNFADVLLNRTPKAAGARDPNAMERLQNTLRSRDYNIATQKMRSRLAGAPAPSLTPAQVRALENAEHDYAVASIGAPRREDVREWDGMYQPVSAPAKRTEPLAFDWSLAVGREKNPFAQKSLARQTIDAIMNREHPASKAYYDHTDPRHSDTVQNVMSLREILNAAD